MKKSTQNKIGNLIDCDCNHLSDVNSSNSLHSHADMNDLQLDSKHTVHV